MSAVSLASVTLFLLLAKQGLDCTLAALLMADICTQWITDMTGLPNIADIITKRRHTLFGHVVKTRCHHTRTPSTGTSRRNKGWSSPWYELAKTSWASPEDMDTAGWRGNPSQLETDVAECGGTWTPWRVVAMDHSCLCMMMMMMMMNYCNMLVACAGKSNTSDTNFVTRNTKQSRCWKQFCISASNRIHRSLYFQFVTC